MPYAVTLRLDAEPAAAVEAVWSALGERGVSNSMRRLAYPPHVTLIVCDDAVDASALTDAVRRLVPEWRSLTLACPALAVFSDQPATLFVIATPTEALLRMQASLCGVVPADRLHPHYRPGTWLPHITVADDLPAARIASAMSLAGAAFRPFAAPLSQVDLLRFRPVKLLWNARLAAADGKPAQSGSSSGAGGSTSPNSVSS